MLSIGGEGANMSKNTAHVTCDASATIATNVYNNN